MSSIHRRSAGRQEWFRRLLGQSSQWSPLLVTRRVLGERGKVANSLSGGSLAALAARCVFSLNCYCLWCPQPRYACFHAGASICRRLLRYQRCNHARPRCPASPSLPYAYYSLYSCPCPHEMMYIARAQTSEMCVRLRRTKYQDDPTPHGFCHKGGGTESGMLTKNYRSFHTGVNGGPPPNTMYHFCARLHTFYQRTEP